MVDYNRWRAKTNRGYWSLAGTVVSTSGIYYDASWNGSSSMEIGAGPLLATYDRSSNLLEVIYFSEDNPSLGTIEYFFGEITDSTTMTINPTSTGGDWIRYAGTPSFQGDCGAWSQLDQDIPISLLFTINNDPTDGSTDPETGDTDVYWGFAGRTAEFFYPDHVGYKDYWDLPEWTWECPESEEAKLVSYGNRRGKGDPPVFAHMGFGLLSEIFALFGDVREYSEEDQLKWAKMMLEYAPLSPYGEELARTQLLQFITAYNHNPGFKTAVDDLYDEAMDPEISDDAQMTLYFRLIRTLWLGGVDRTVAMPPPNGPTKAERAMDREIQRAEATATQ